MKNLKINTELRNKIATGVLSVVLVAGGVLIGAAGNQVISEHQAEKNKTNNDYILEKAGKTLEDKLSQYESRRLELEKEIDDLLEKKEQLQNNQTFDIKDLIVMEHTDANGSSDLYILNHVATTAIYVEYHNEFQAWYNLHEDDTEDHRYDFCSSYIHFYEAGHPLIDYLSPSEKEYVGKNNGKITTLELDVVLEDLRDSYHFQLEEAESAKSYVKS